MRLAGDVKHRRVAFVGMTYSWVYMLTRPWEFVRWIVGETRAFVHRGWHGWAHQDVWGFDNYLFMVISDALDELRAHKPGCSFDYLEQYGDQAWEQFRKDLEHTAATLREVGERQYDYTLTGDEQLALWEQAKRAMYWVAENISALWW